MLVSETSIVEVKSGKCFLRVHRSCVLEAAKVVPHAASELGSVKVTQGVLLPKERRGHGELRLGTVRSQERPGEVKW